MKRAEFSGDDWHPVTRSIVFASQPFTELAVLRRLPPASVSQMFETMAWMEDHFDVRSPAHFGGSDGDTRALVAGPRWCGPRPEVSHR
jgi:hypothetical protein